MSKKTVFATVSALAVGVAAGVGGLYAAQVHAANSKEHWVVVDNSVHPDGSSPFTLPASRDGDKLSLNGVTVGSHLESVFPACKGSPVNTTTPCWATGPGPTQPQHPSGDVRLRGLPAVLDGKLNLMVTSTLVSLDEHGDVTRIYVSLDPHVTAPRDYRTILSLTKALGQPTTSLATSVQWVVGPNSVAVNDGGRTVVAGVND
ncbi:hypothetical protein QHI69_00945 [Burkholderia gladioli pv. gladioli]|uniref:hypothetical protein n=1 Tax=Burkholderiaceae TaxID=119060 RepID=UPI00161E8A77|nr:MULTISPECIES: hypothetical protein [Burkholderiaceae]MBB2981365.1 hypothetical protein [Paraburkholderia tropica]MDJ1160470.1 hypothetical protein [Burkholderia gladioli pv. gladioli]